MAKRIPEQTVKAGDYTWVYREVVPESPNDRPPVLLLHGLVAFGYSWRKVLPALAEQGFRAIAPDFPGFGASDRPERLDFAYTPDALIGLLEQFLAAMELDRVSIVAQGFFGSLGIQYALRNPDRIERLAMINAPIFPEAKLPWKISQMAIPLVGDMMTQDPLLVDRLLEGGGPYQVDDADLDVYRRPFLTSSGAGRALLAVLQNLRLKQTVQEITEGLTRWEKPTLVAWGTSDPWLPVEAAKTAAKTIADCEFVEMDETGHYAQEDWPEKVSEALIPFLRRMAT